jgi:hypothetical protein
MIQSNQLLSAGPSYSELTILEVLGTTENSDSLNDVSL